MKSEILSIETTKKLVNLDKVISILEQAIPVFDQWYWDGKDVNIKETIMKIYELLKGEPYARNN